MSRKSKERHAAKPSRENYLIVKVDESGVSKEHHKTGKRIYVTVNALVFSLNEARRRFDRVKGLLLHFDAEERASGELNDGNFQIGMKCAYRNEIVSTAWDTVDWLARARKLLGSISGISKKEASFKETMDALRPAAEYRDMLQHFDRDVVPTLEKRTFPVMGAILAGYSDGAKRYGRIILSTPARYACDPTVSIAGANAIAAEVTLPVDNITLSVAHATINLSDIFLRLETCIKGLRELLSDKYQFDWSSVDPGFD